MRKKKSKKFSSIEDCFHGMTGTTRKEMTKSYQKLNQKAFEILRTICQDLKNVHSTGKVTLYTDLPKSSSKVHHALAEEFLCISYSFLVGARKNLHGILLLTQRKLWEPSQSLVRILIENFVTYACFINLFNESPSDICQRFFDCHTLITNKKHKVSGMSNLVRAIESPSEDWEDVLQAQQFMEQQEDGISKKYSEDEINSMRRNGFTCFTVEQRAQKSGYHSLYQSLYRSFSKNVHSTDFFEHVMSLEGVFQEDFIYARNLASTHAVNTCILPILDASNAHFGLRHTDEIEALIEQSKFPSYNNSSLGKIHLKLLKKL